LPVPLHQLTDGQGEDLRATLRQARRPEQWTPSAEVLLARAAAAHGADAKKPKAG
jgi:hypothetical protein